MPTIFSNSVTGNFLFEDIFSLVLQGAGGRGGSFKMTRFSQIRGKGQKFSWNAISCYRGVSCLAFFLPPAASTLNSKTLWIPWLLPFLSVQQPLLVHPGPKLHPFNTPSSQPIAWVLPLYWLFMFSTVDRAFASFHPSVRGWGGAAPSPLLTGSI